MDILTRIIPFAGTIKMTLFQIINIFTIRSGNKNNVKKLEITNGNYNMKVIYNNPVIEQMSSQISRE